MYNNRLRLLRDKNNISLDEIAVVLGITKSCYCHYEAEDDIIPLKHLNIICNFFNVSFDYIFRFTDKLNYDNSLRDINKIKVGNRLKEFRKNMRITQEKLASILNTTQSVIAGYEVGRRLIATPFLYEICKKYKISADYILGKINTPIYIKELVVV